MREVDAGEGVGAEVPVAGGCVFPIVSFSSNFFFFSPNFWSKDVFAWSGAKKGKGCLESGDLTMCVLLLIVAGVAGVVLRLLLLVMPAASAAAAKHLVEEAELGAGEGEE